MKPPPTQQEYHIVQEMTKGFLDFILDYRACISGAENDAHAYPKENRRKVSHLIIGVAIEHAPQYPNLAFPDVARASIPMSVARAMFSTLVASVKALIGCNSTRCDETQRSISFFLKKKKKKNLYTVAAVAERLACSPPTKANRVQSPAGPPPDFRVWESCRTMPLPLNSSAALFSPHFILIGSQGLVVKSRANISTQLFTPFDGTFSMRRIFHTPRPRVPVQLPSPLTSPSSALKTTWQPTTPLTRFKKIPRVSLLVAGLCPAGPPLALSFSPVPLDVGCHCTLANQRARAHSGSHSTVCNAESATLAGATVQWRALSPLLYPTNSFSTPFLNLPTPLTDTNSSLNTFHSLTDLTSMDCLPRSVLLHTL
ncbi:hypothetical protein PR048_030214 [Dryococelus australis]|uniref:Uncharacterized protein n=1 Tax=Dryococelus australis TaxID=614101 RepID=A0ABQ9G8B0_9NEOP|nr:hypothetical protein PR048_030214 [Dryococelus australis]